MAYIAEPTEPNEVAAPVRRVEWLSAPDDITETMALDRLPILLIT